MLSFKLKKQTSKKVADSTFKIFKGCLSQFLLGLVLNTSSPITLSLTCVSVILDLVQATEKLMDTVKSGAPTERWIAVQCLGEHDYHDDCVINELISYVNGGDMIKNKMASELLKRLSCFTVSTMFAFFFFCFYFVWFLKNLQMVECVGNCCSVIDRYSY